MAKYPPGTTPSAPAAKAGGMTWFSNNNLNRIYLIPVKNQVNNFQISIMWIVSELFMQFISTHFRIHACSSRNPDRGRALKSSSLSIKSSVNDLLEIKLSYVSQSYGGRGKSRSPVAEIRGKPPFQNLRYALLFKEFRPGFERSAGEPLSELFGSSEK